MARYIILDMSFNWTDEQQVLADFTVKGKCPVDKAMKVLKTVKKELDPNSTVKPVLFVKVKGQDDE